MQNKKTQRIKRHKHIRSRVSGSEATPRLTVFRSNKHIYAQIIDDKKAVTIVSASDFNLKDNKKNNVEAAAKIGELLAETAKGKKVTKVVFDRSGYKFHGRVKALAEGARKGGLSF